MIFGFNLQAEDAGSALGAALIGWHDYLKKPRKINPNDSMKGTYLGCNFSNKEIKTYLKKLMLLIMNLRIMIFSIKLQK